MDSRLIRKALDVLITENYSYNVISGAWKRGKEQIDEWEVTAAVIYWARKNTRMRDIGVFAEGIIKSAKQMPEFTNASFIKQYTVRDRGKRIAGKHLFAAWCKAVNIKIEGTLEDCIRRNSLLVSKFYDYLANGMACVKKRARILGELASSVFIGWALKEEDKDDTQAISSRILIPAGEERRCNQLPSPKHNHTRVRRRRCNITT